MYELPTSVEINDNTYEITNKGDYRMVIDCFIALNDIELSKEERIYACLIMFYEDLNDIEDIVELFGDNIEQAVNEMFNFFNCGKKSVGATSHHKLIDWEQDEQLIASAINNVANIEIRTCEYVHWWTFMGYYTSIGEGVLSTVVGIRDKIVKNKKLEPWEKEFRYNNSDYFMWEHRTMEEMELDAELERIKSQWK